MNHWSLKTLLLGIVAIYIGLFGVALVPETGNANENKDKLDSHEFPKVANINLYSPFTLDDAKELAQWDVLILNPHTEVYSLPAMKEIRRLNPDIILLVYVTAQEVPTTYYKQWESDPSGFWHTLINGVTEEMYVRDQNGEHVYFWAQDRMTNPDTAWSDLLSSHMIDTFFIKSNMWDGIFYDNTWIDISWINNGNIDLNRDGQKDSITEIRTQWERGMDRLFDLTRQKAPKEIILVGNGDQGYYDKINGIFFEDLELGGTDIWNYKQGLYQQSDNGHQDPTLAIIHNKGSQGNYRAMRYGLGTALLGDGYYSYDIGASGHDNIWWYDEYDINLGEPLGPATSLNGVSKYENDVWRRDFANGVSVVNSTNSTFRVDLGGEFEKIHGTQDPITNDGSIVSEVTISPRDALLLLKTFQGIKDTIFTNGEFARFFAPDGSRVRNGFFVFDDRYQGGAHIASIDLDNNSQRDLIVARGNRLEAWRDDGLRFIKKFPYTVNYQGELQIATGDLNEDGLYEIYVAPSPGEALPIKVYTRHGRQMRRDWYPFGEGYTGGYTIAVKESDGRRNNELVIGTGVGQDPKVHVYDRNLDFVTSFSPFEASVRGGVSVASGDLDGDGKGEIVVGAGPGSDPRVRIFDGVGTQLYSEFVAYSTFTKPGVDVRVVDVDFDGNDEIVTLSDGF